MSPWKLKGENHVPVEKWTIYLDEDKKNAMETYNWGRKMVAKAHKEMVIKEK